MDDTPFDSRNFDGLPRADGKKRGASTSADERARKQALQQPDRDANEVREEYALAPLGEEALARWLGSE